MMPTTVDDFLAWPASASGRIDTNRSLWSTDLAELSPAMATVAAGSTFVATASLFTPAVASQALRMTGALGTAGCADPVKPPDAIKHPFQFSLGPPNASDAEWVAGLWAAAGLTALIGIVALTLVIGIVGTILCYVVDDPTLDAAVDASHGFQRVLLMARWPGCMVGAMVAMLGPAVESFITALLAVVPSIHVAAVTLLIASTVIAMSLLAFIATVTADRTPTVNDTTCTSTATVTAKGFFASRLIAVPNDKMSALILFRLRRIVRGELEWASASETDTTVAKSHYQHEIIYEDYRATRRWFTVVDIGLGLSSAAVGAVRSSNQLVCWTTKGLCLGLAVLYLFAIAALRPFLKPIDTVQAMLTGVAAAVIAALVLCDAIDAAEKVAATGVLLFVVRIALTSFLWILDQGSRRAKARTRPVHCSFLADGLLVGTQHAATFAIDDDETLLTPAPAPCCQPHLRAARLLAEFDLDDAAAQPDAFALECRPVDNGLTDMIIADKRLVIANTGMANPLMAAYGTSLDAILDGADPDHEVHAHRSAELFAWLDSGVLGGSNRFTADERQQMI